MDLKDYENKVENILIERYNINETHKGSLIGVINRVFYKEEKSPEDLIKEIRLIPKGKEVIEKITVEKIEETYKDAVLRKYLPEALKEVRSGVELSSGLNYGFFPEDIITLAELHKEHKQRRKIEELLEDCNYHTENRLLKEEKYDELLDSPEYKDFTDKEGTERE